MLSRLCTYVCTQLFGLDKSSLPELRKLTNFARQYVAMYVISEGLGTRLLSSNMEYKWMWHTWWYLNSDSEEREYLWNDKYVNTGYCSNPMLYSVLGIWGEMLHNHQGWRAITYSYLDYGSLVWDILFNPSYLIAWIGMHVHNTV